MERQSLGFQYEEKVIKQRGLIKSISYTAAFDGFNPNTKRHVQIKSYKDNNALMMGSPTRWLQCKEDFELTIGNFNTSKMILSEVTVLIDHKKLQQYFKKEDMANRVARGQALLNSVSNSRSDDARFKNGFKALKAARKGRKLQVQLKRDHKNQKRIQWAIPNESIIPFLSAVSAGVIK